MQKTRYWLMKQKQFKRLMLRDFFETAAHGFSAYQMQVLQRSNRKARKCKSWLNQIITIFESIWGSKAPWCTTLWPKKTCVGKVVDKLVLLGCFWMTNWIELGRSISFSFWVRTCSWVSSAASASPSVSFPLNVFIFRFSVALLSKMFLHLGLLLVLPFLSVLNTE